MPRIAAISAVPLIFTLSPVHAAEPAEFFDRPAFLARAGVLRVIDFDSKSPGDNAIAENEYLSRGLRIVQRAGLGINVVQNTVPGGYGANFVTAANLNSAPNAISTSIGASSASPGPPDNFDFILTRPATAAGLFVGNLGALGDQATLIEFLDADGRTIAAESIDGSHPGVVNGSLGVNWDNRIFYGTVSETPVKTIRVTKSKDSPREFFRLQGKP
jgi:hypothetical protein